MPIVKRGIAHPLAYPDPALYEQSPPDMILQNIDMASFSGAMQQLGILASYATEMFQDLYDIANEQSKRLVRASEKTSSILARLEEVEGVVSSNTQMLGTVGGTDVAVREPVEVASGLFNKEAMPSAIKSRYVNEAVQRAPPLDTVDEIVLPETRVEWGPCAARFSNPKFFFEEFLQAEEERQRLIKEEKAKRRKERKARKEAQRRRLAEEKVAQAPTKKKGLNWREGLEAYDLGGTTRQLGQMGISQSLVSQGPSVPPPREAP
eukprot:CAMPEP_0118864620 /NCGR_PEP_ID=MMETSP1163-20130328/9141_1 /TAXON_ID=124430 /ORGANISM="Phaeomonas parva, Strain CCMP2877" /LENGTH=263 /DNA_ID=CAMNT_0006798767 /DNA_START=148 /DNA_END=936 /DNA_ORIENTATION=+